jgi:hypothetical protein
MRLNARRVIVAAAALFLFAVSVSARDTKLWLAYGLPSNPDLEAGARSEVAKARTQRTVTLAACAATPSFTDCPRQAEITFRGHLLGIPGVRLQLYQEVGSWNMWLLDVRGTAVDPDFDQNFCHLEEGRLCPLGIHLDDSGRQLVRDSDSRVLRFSDQALVDGILYINSMLGLGKNASYALANLASKDKSWDAGQVEMVYFLLNHGADPDYSSGIMSGFVDSSGVLRFYQRRLLYKAVETDDARLVGFIVEQGADVNASGGPNGGRALMYAASLGFTDLVKLLLDLGADINLKDRSEETALQKAKKAGHAEAAALLQQRGGT